MQSADVQVVPAVPATPKFSDVLWHWTASDLEGDWQKVIQDALEPLVAVGRLTVDVTPTTVAINAGGSSLLFSARNKRARGSVSKHETAWIIALCLLKLSKHLTMTVVDDDSVVVDRRYLFSMIGALGVSVEEFDDVAEKLELVVSKSFVKANPVIANFF